MPDNDIKVLILDDTYSHVEEFKKRLKTVGITDVTHIATAMGCIEKLMKEDYDIIFLDYDLGESPSWAKDIDNCGGSVSEWIQLNPDVIGNDTKIIIHSVDYLGDIVDHESSLSAHRGVTAKQRQQQWDDSNKVCFHCIK